ncbi:MAG: hypothetical protein OWS74_09105 [Firmicutes bacterium]|nr:hypothetical protein [Bacillota bacterium]
MDKTMADRLPLALGQINAEVGAISRNMERMLRVIEKVRVDHVPLLTFPEMSLVGYPPEDRLFQSSLLTAVRAAEETLILASRRLFLIFGSITLHQGRLYNTAVVAVNGRILDRVFKQKLPNYGVFDEVRYFSPGERTTVYDWHGWRLGVSVCEDMWYPDGPYLQQARAGADVLINISASPFFFI